MNPETFDDQYKCIPFLAMLYIAFALASPILTNKLILTPVAIVSASVIVGPLFFMLGDVIAEVYGYSLVMNLFWSAMVCQLAAGFICHYLLGLSSPASWHGQAQYDIVLGHFLAHTTAEVMALIISWRINAYLITKWKILLHGKYFWLRSVGSSMIGQFIFTLILSPLLLWFVTVKNLSNAFHLFVWICVIRFSLTTLLAIVAWFGVLLLKRIEKTDIYETKENFSFLKWI